MIPPLYLKINLAVISSDNEYLTNVKVPSQSTSNVLDIKLNFTPLVLDTVRNVRVENKIGIGSAEAIRPVTNYFYMLGVFSRTQE